MKYACAILLASMVMVTAYGQTNYFKNPGKIETDEYVLEFKNAICTQEECKLAISVDNKTNDFLLLNNEEITFKLGDDDIDSKKDKTIFIDPNKSKNKVLRIVGGSDYLVENFTINIQGLYSLSTSETVQSVEDFQLPAKSNQITTDKFKISLVKLKKKTQETEAVFECEYLGSGYGIINPSKLSVTAKSKAGEDIEYANDDKKDDILILERGDTEKITAVFHIEGKVLDMQFATLFVKWNETFIDSQSKKLEDQVVNFDIDEALTKEKN